MSKQEKKKILFGKSRGKKRFVPMMGHWNNDTERW